jgi:putative heme transporter
MESFTFMRPTRSRPRSQGDRTVASEPAPIAATTRQRFSWKSLAGGAVGVAVVVATFVFVLPQIADYRDVWDVVKELSWGKIALLLGATALNLATFAPPWQAALPGLSFRQAFSMTQASTASTYVLPGGAAVGAGVSYVMLRNWGFTGRPVTLALALTGIWNQFALLGFPVVALALLTLSHEQHPLLQTVALIGLAVLVLAAGCFAAALSSDRLAFRVGDTAARVAGRLLRIVHRPPPRFDGATFVAFRHEALGVLGKRWHVLTIAVLAGQLSVFVLFFVCLRVFGVSGGEVSVIEAFASWSLVRLLGSLPITPGGIGVVEVGLTSALVGFGGRNAEVVAAVLVYRFLSIVPTLVLGLGAGATFRRQRPAVG